MSDYKPEDLEARADVEARSHKQACHMTSGEGVTRADLEGDVGPAAEMLLAGAQAMRDLEAAQEALRWYSYQVYNCHNCTTIGDTARDALAKDGGAKARAALQVKP